MHPELLDHMCTPCVTPVLHKCIVESKCRRKGRTITFVVACGLRRLLCPFQLELSLEHHEECNYMTGISKYITTKLASIQNTAGSCKDVFFCFVIEQTSRNPAHVR